MISVKYLSFILIFALSVSALAAPMRDSGGRPVQDFEQDVQGEPFSFLERKSPGWFGGPKTETPEEELALARKLEKAGEFRDAARRYNAIVKHWGSSPEAPAAQKAYADLMLQREKMERAFEEYQYLIKFYAGEFDYDTVLEQQMKIANYMMTTPRGSFLFFPGFLSPEKAIPYYEQIIANGPKWRGAPEAQFNVGLISEETGELEDAVLAYDAVMNRFRGHGLAPDASFRKAVCLMKLWRKTPRDERSLRSALSAFASFVAAYPSSSDVPEARDHIAGLREKLAGMYFAQAEFYEKVKKNKKAAIIAYTEFVRQFPTSGKAAEAKERIDILKNKQKAEK